MFFEQVLPPVARPAELALAAGTPVADLQVLRHDVLHDLTTAPLVAAAATAHEAVRHLAEFRGHCVACKRQREREPMNGWT